MGEDKKYQELTDSFIESLLECEKEIIASPKPKGKSQANHKETGLKLKSIDSQYMFSVFIRGNMELIENFSVGLVYHRDSESDLILVRYNGDHGGHENKVTNEAIEGGFHIHRFTMEAFEKGIRAENYAEATGKYATLNGAILVFFNDLNVKNYSKYFPELNQINFNF